MTRPSDDNSVYSLPAKVGIGIDFGMTYSGGSIYYRKSNGKTFMNSIPIRDEGNKAKFPTMVFVHDDPHQENLVGDLAYGAALRKTKGHLYTLFKRHLGTKWQENQEGRIITAQSLVTDVLKEIRQNTEAYLLREGLMEPKIKRQYTFTHPAKWGDLKKQQFRTAILAAGFGEKEIILIDEPIATALAVDRNMGHPEIYKGSDRYMLVCDIGGGTLDLALINATESGITVKAASDGDPELGMSNLDLIIGLMLFSKNGLLLPGAKKILDNHIVKGSELRKAWEDHQPPNKFLWQQKSEDLKMTICNRWNHEDVFATVAPGTAAGIILTKEEILPFVTQMQKEIQAAIYNYLAGLSKQLVQASNIKFQIISGGGSYLPDVANVIKEFLASKSIKVDHLDIAHDIVASMVQRGAAIFAAEGGIRDIRVNTTYGVKTYVGIPPTTYNTTDTETVEKKVFYASYRRFISKGDKVSAGKSNKQTFTPLRPNQEAVSFKVLQGESDNPAQNTVIGHVNLPLPAGTLSDYEVECTFLYEQTLGTIQVFARDPHTNIESNYFTFTPDLSEE